MNGARPMAMADSSEIGQWQLKPCFLQVRSSKRRLQLACASTKWESGLIIWSTDVNEYLQVLESTVRTEFHQRRKSLLEESSSYCGLWPGLGFFRVMIREIPSRAFPGVFWMEKEYGIPSGLIKTGESWMYYLEEANTIMQLNDFCSGGSILSWAQCQKNGIRAR